MRAAVLSAGPWWTVLVVLTILLVGVVLVRATVYSTVKQNRRLRKDNAEACVFVAHRRPSTEETVDFLGASRPRRLLGEPLPMYFSVVADAEGLRLLSPQDSASPHLTVLWTEVGNIATGSVGVRGGTIATLNITVERASRSYQLQLVVGNPRLGGTYPLGARGVGRLIDRLTVFRSTPN